MIDILACKTPEKLFPSAEQEGEAMYRRLVKEHHPDYAVDDADRERRTAVTTHLTLLMREARKKWKSGNWVDPKQFTFSDGEKNFRLPLLARHQTDYGELLVAESVIGYVYNEQNLDLCQIAKQRGSLVFDTPDPAVKYKNPVSRSGKAGTSEVLFYSKTPADLLLRDVIAHGTVETRSACWMVSRMFNILAALHRSKLMHGALLPENLVVNPADHTMFLLGGYCFSAEFGTKLVALPAAALRYMPPSVKAKKVATPLVDLECLKLTGRSILGDPSGSKLRSRADVPAPISLFLNSPASESVHAEWEAWDRVLTDSYGPRKFVEMKLSADDLYGQKGN